MKRISLFGMSLIVLFSSCAKSIVTEEEFPIVEQALEDFAGQLGTTLADKDALSLAISGYLESHDKAFYGSTVTVLDSNGAAAYSPYVYRHKNGFIHTDELMNPSYDINNQAWLRAPIDQGQSVWSEPYFDEGGGEVWMRTRSVPIYLGPVIVAVATTDVSVKKP